jgi:hypothetical protein
MVIGSSGGLLMLFGAFRLFTEVSTRNLLFLALWLAGAVAIHDGVLAPVVVGIGAALRRIPARARRFVQGALIAGGLVTVIALPLIHRENSQPKVKAVLQQDFTANVAILLTIVAGVAVLLYLVRVVSGGQAASATNDRPSDDHASSSE